MVGVISGSIGLIVAAALGYSLISLVSIVIHWLAIGVAVFSAGYMFYELVSGNYLDAVFDTEEVTSIFAGVFSAVTGFILYRLLEALFAAFGLLATVLVGGVIVLAWFTSPAYIAGGVATALGLVADLVDIFAGGDQ